MCEEATLWNGMLIQVNGSSRSRTGFTDSPCLTLIQRERWGRRRRRLYRVLDCQVVELALDDGRTRGAHYLRHGLPSWFTPLYDPEADEAIKTAFGDLGIDEQRLPRHEVRLSREATAAKMMAMRAYLTEFDAIDDDFGGVASTADLMRHETYRTVT